MLTSILNLEGVQNLDRNQQVTVKGGGTWNTPNAGGGYLPNGEEEKDDGCGNSGCH